MGQLATSGPACLGSATHPATTLAHAQPPHAQNILDHTQFSVRVAEQDLAKLPSILTTISPSQLLVLQTNVGRVWHRSASASAWGGLGDLGVAPSGYPLGPYRSLGYWY